MTDKEVLLVKEGLALLDEGLSKLAAIENNDSVNLISKLVHGAILTAEMVLNLS